MIYMYVLLVRIARVMLQKKYQERVEQCVSKSTQHEEPHRPTSIHSLIAQTLGLQLDTTSKLSSIYKLS